MTVTAGNTVRDLSRMEEARRLLKDVQSGRVAVVSGQAATVFAFIDLEIRQLERLLHLREES